jgi:hypothetical protein
MVASRLAVVLAGLTVALPALAQDMTPEHARRFVVGKTFAYSCFEGTTGAGRIRGDGSVAGTIQLQGSGPVRRAALPAGTLQVKGEKVCASVKGLPFQPCFNLQQTSSKSFRGSISGFGFAYCDFVQGGGRGRGRAHFARSVSNRNKPIALRPTAAAE